MPGPPDRGGGMHGLVWIGIGKRGYVQVSMGNRLPVASCSQISDDGVILRCTDFIPLASFPNSSDLGLAVKPMVLINKDLLLAQPR